MGGRAVGALRAGGAPLGVGGGQGLHLFEQPLLGRQPRRRGVSVTCRQGQHEGERAEPHADILHAAQPMPAPAARVGEDLSFCIACHVGQTGALPPFEKTRPT
ncbi:MAG: hypothetical protein A2X53_16405 [Candidatus Rokubacteria bacterium GWA2_70_23]|nr:MAG: hypothetical protein A2X53_16405 [Candidatus Rokubacteria bacterium GWA2_70_23]